VGNRNRNLLAQFSRRGHLPNEGERTLPISPSEPKEQTRKTIAGILGRGEPKERPWGFAPVVTEGRAEATVQRAERAIKALGEDAEFIMVYYGSDAAGGFQTLDRPLRTITTLDRFAYQLLWINQVALATEQLASTDFLFSSGIDASGDTFYHGAAVGLQYVR
jgi:hypothetical protein